MASSGSVLDTLAKLQAAHDRGSSKVQLILQEATAEILSRFAILRSEFMP